MGEADRAQVVSTADPVGDVAFGDASHGWRVGAGGLILATVDGGATWTRQASPTAAALTAVDAVSATRAWAVGPSGLLLRTVDGGANWAQVQLGTGKDLRGVEFVDADHGWIVEWYGAIRATSDGGVTWTAQTSGYKPFAALTFVDANLGFAGGGGTGNDRFVWRTDDGGRSWHEVLGQPAPSSSIRAIDFADRLHGIAVGTNGFSFRTSDGGSSWTETSTGFGTEFSGVAMVDGTHAITVGFDRSSPAAPVRRFYATSDAGAAWTLVASAPLGDVAAITERPGGGFVAAGPGATTYASSDGTTWAASVDEARSPATLRGLATSGDHLVAVGDGGAVRTSHDGGVTWRDVVIDPAVDLTGVAAVGTEAWAVGSAPDLNGTEQPVVLHSADHGDTWNPIGAGLPGSRRVNAVTFTDTDHGWVVGSGPGGSGAGFVAVTTDGGANWTVQTQTYPFPLTSIEVIGQNVWAMSTHAYARSTDGGATWELLTSESDPAIPAPGLAGFDFIDAQHGWIGAFDRVLTTADGGATWQTLDNPYGFTVRQVRFVDSLHGWALDWYSRVLQTTDGGVTWTPSWVPALRGNDALTSVALDASNRAWLTGGATVAVAPSRREATVALAGSAPTGITRTVTATVAGVDLGSTAPSPPIPSGSVRFTQGATVVATVALSDAGTASAVVSSAATAAPVVADYLGDGVFGSAPSPALVVAARPPWYPHASASAFVDAVNRGLRGVALTPSQRAAEAAKITTPAAAAAYVANRLGDRYCTGAVGPTYRLYSGFFNRPPDSPGLAYWVGKLRRGTPLASAAASFAGSSEFARTYGTITNGAYVDLVYRNVLGRAPDGSGRAYWVKKLDAGTSRGAVMTSISESSENRRKTAGAVTVESLAFCTAGRAATRVELTGGANALGHGVPVTTLVRELLATAQIRPPAPR